MSTVAEDPTPRPAPDGVSEEDLQKMLKWLDGLRKVGSINMFGAARPLAARFKIDMDVARKVHVYWMETFGERHPNG